MYIVYLIFYKEIRVQFAHIRYYFLNWSLNGQMVPTRTERHTRSHSELFVIKKCRTFQFVARYTHWVVWGQDPSQGRLRVDSSGFDSSTGPLPWVKDINVFPEGGDGLWTLHRSDTPVTPKEIHLVDGVLADRCGATSLQSWKKFEDYT